MSCKEKALRKGWCPRLSCPTTHMMQSLDLQPACALQGEGIQERQVPLPELPPNAVYVSHQNLCYDWGTFGWVLQTGMVDTTKYKHIIFMNSSSRGPFLPAYWPVSSH